MRKSIYSEYGKGELHCSPELSNIANYLLLGSSYINDVSLFHGKAGAMLALYSFSEKYHKPIFHEYADDLMQDIYKMVHDNLPIGIEQGLAGIGYAFTLLSNSDIIECDLNDVLYTIDHTIMCHDCRRMTDYTVKTGLFGVWLYICERMRRIHRGGGGGAGQRTRRKQDHHAEHRPLCTPRPSHRCHHLRPQCRHGVDPHRLVLPRPVEAAEAQLQRLQP